MTIKLSDIPQRDAFEILAAATKSCAVCHFRDQLAFTTPQLCALLKARPYEIDETVSTYPAEILAGEVFIAIGDELLELLRALGMSDRPIASARLWTPRAALRIAALMRNPVAKAIHLRVAAYAASIEAENWALYNTQPWWAHTTALDEPMLMANPSASAAPIGPEKYLHPPYLSSINELPPLQPEVATLKGEVATPPHESSRFQPEVATLKTPRSEVATSLSRESEGYSDRVTTHDKYGHSQ